VFMVTGSTGVNRKTRQNSMMDRLQQGPAVRRAAARATNCQSVIAMTGTS
jgi:hypothetical protein